MLINTEIDMTTASPSDLLIELAQRRIDEEGASVLVSRAILLLEQKIQELNTIIGYAQSISVVETECKQEDQLKERLEAFKKLQMEFNGNPQSKSISIEKVAENESTSEPIPHEIGGRVIWHGNKASWERVYEALKVARLIDPSPSSWAALFMDERGNPMSPPEGGSAVYGEGRDPKIKTTVNVIRSQSRT